MQVQRQPPPNIAGRVQIHGEQINTQAILAEFADGLRARLGDRFAGLWLYGSQARGDAGPESDIDLILSLRGMERPGQEIDRILDLLAELNIKYQVLISVLPLEEGALETSQGAFWHNVRREGRAV
ncbi:MAG: nucleotidyltransferase domain-containing protein [Halochromatium sp.]|uniref:nucleotidyltransferase domain-containing protein n=1 Tax=Halochromatium sp. TaxID=2049430 RepID=UPI00397BCB80